MMITFWIQRHSLLSLEINFQWNYNESIFKARNRREEKDKKKKINKKGMAL